jgi:TetR/AcrR family transcriptional regulator, fatty acid metabolism regulator protein
MRIRQSMALRATRPDKLRPEPRAVGQWGVREAGILDVASRLYAARGYERVSMADVAAAAGLSEGTLYNYFRDKSDLVLSVGLASLEQNIAGAEAITNAATSLEDGLRRLIAHQIRDMVSAPELYRIWLREVKAAEGYGKSRARDALRRFSGHFLLFLDRWHAPAVPLSLDPPVMRDMFYGGIEQIAWTAIVQRQKRTMDIDEMAAKLAAAYISAFGLTAVRRPLNRKLRKLSPAN